MITYEEAVAYINEIPKFTKKHSLSHTKEFLRRLGNPQTEQNIIHVAGTNGKGSVCAYMQAILQAEGKKVGFFTSPHLIKINERIRINGEEITDSEFLDAFLIVREAVEHMEKEGLEHPSYFEYLFGIGMVYFAKHSPDYLILETGLGGRLDATNAIEHPVLTIITSISLDHTMYLGDTVEAIAGEKAGIIKPFVPLIYDGSDEEAKKVISACANENGAPCREVSKNAFEWKEITDKSIAFYRRNAYDDTILWKLKGWGTYQAMNSSLALEAMEELLIRKQQITEKEEIRSHQNRWREALEQVCWEGRMEEVLPEIYVDGAHNPGAIQAFIDSVQGVDEKGEGILLFSAVEDKDYEQMIRNLCHSLHIRTWIVTEVEDQRKVDAKKLAEVFEKYTDAKIIVEKEIDRALAALLREKKQEERAYCLGSLYLVGMIKERWKGKGRAC